MIKKILLWTVGGLAGLIAITGIIGLFLPAEVSADVNTAIARPPEQVYDLLGNFEDMPKWAGGEITKVEKLDAEGMRYRCEGAMGAVEYVWLKKERPGHLAARMLPNGIGVSGDWHITIEPVPAGSTIRSQMTLNMSNPWMRLLAKMGGASAEELKTLNQLKAYLESH